jgi:hypothetical protein
MQQHTLAGRALGCARAGLPEVRSLTRLAGQGSASRLVFLCAGRTPPPQSVSEPEKEPELEQAMTDNESDDDVP